MTELSRHDDPLTELQFALAEGDAQRPPTNLGHAVLDAALAARAAGRPTDEPNPISPDEAFRRAVRSLDALLTSLDPREWARGTVRGLDVQQLLGHLIGVEGDFQAAQRDPHGAQADAEHVASTDSMALAQVGRPPSETHDDWRAMTAVTLDALADVGSSPARLAEVIALHGLRMPLGPFLVVRTFELWTHEEDIRRATSRPLQAPDPASLRLMTELAVAMLPAGLRHIDRSGAGSSARVVLTGPGGGTWQTGLGAASDAHRHEGPVDVRIVVDAVDFCRLVANRIDPDALESVITGDGTLALDLFTGAASLALD
jgi:uncharacterized protein (TIGR03083 family)